MLTFLRVFFFFFLKNSFTLFGAPADTSSPHFTCVTYVLISWLSALVFPENPDGTHLVATHCIVTPFLGMVHAVLSQLPFPFTLPSFLCQRTSLYCPIHTFYVTLHFIWKTSNSGVVLQRPQMYSYTKLFNAFPLLLFYFRLPNCNIGSKSKN